MGQQRLRQAAEPQDLTSALEKKKLEYEFIKEQRRKFEASMELLDLEARRGADEVSRLEHDLGRFTTGHQSEPTTPPEYRDHGFPSAFSRPNRFSSASMTSPPGLSNRPGRSGSQLTSSPSGFTRPFTSRGVASNLPSKSVPGSRRNSDEDEDDYLQEVTSYNHRSAANPNRNSMPVTGLDLRGRTDMPDLASVLGHINTTGFLFGDDEDKPKKTHNPAASPDAKNYLQMNTTNDKFPILVRREGDGIMQLSASSAALDLALSQSPGPESQQANGWPTFTRQHASQQSLPMNTLRQNLQSQEDSGLPNFNGIKSESPPKPTAFNRRSLEVKFSGIGEIKQPGLMGLSSHGPANGFPKLQSSYSTNDIPTLKSTNGLNGASSNVPAAVPKTAAEQHFHNHNASLGRIPQNAVNSANTANTVNSNRLSRELTSGDVRAEEAKKTFRPLQSALQASAVPFGPPLTSTATESIGANAMSAGLSPFASPAYYGGYGMPMLGMAMHNLNVGGQPQWNTQMSVYQNPYGAYQQYPQYGNGNVNGNGGARFADSQARVIQQRRMQNGEDNARFANVQLESLQGEIYGLCKDQHGCRYLQKKLEDRNPEHVQLIFLETNEHVTELMTDPFGNYLCQKLLEYTNNEQRTIEMIIDALRNEVVQLIQDLNGNHVIQKCLNHLTSEDAQFIFDARCIDHASGHQKAYLVAQITNNAFALVQDPFGNYVVQYILDLGEPAFSKPLCLSFCGNIAVLSKQKFSSNVIEKCIRTADADTRRLMIEEMINPAELEKLLRDSFANYVVQTAMDHADPDTKARLIDSIRPILPAIRSTPYGRRIQGKIQERDGNLSGNSSGQTTPNNLTSPPQITMGVSPMSRQGLVQNGHGYQSNSGMHSGIGNGYGPTIVAPQPQSQPHRLSKPSLPMYTSNQGPRMAPQQYPGFGRAPQPDGPSLY
ncbi:hypothetical protein B0A49_05219 [Cryomyces minteri]|uniref:PUM-HD domain-containing protein n=1 Tax=Cryomyces minteri TaxID=331657 RepID=A0A4U0X5N2_9PEZI|nr:hypothetical protein B0A49_05219 [Cryomyces minteri]